MTKKEIQSEKSNALPCSLSSISITNFQGIKKLSIKDLPLKARWIFLTGENGFGKTSILRAIAKGLVGNEPFVSYISEKKLFIFKH